MTLRPGAQIESNAVRGSVDGDTAQAPGDVSVNLVRICVIAVMG